LKLVQLAILIHLILFESVAFSDRTSTKSKLIDLLWAKEEIHQISDIFDSSKILLFDDATEYTFKNIASEAKILHLATHTILNDSFPLHSRLVLKPDKWDIDDGFLNTYEIYNLDMNSDLVVLSACNTAIGKLIESEGMMSLARGFKYAGSNSLIVSLWALDDKSTTELMLEFYKHLAKKKKISEALRQSKLEYINRTESIKAAPFFWGAMIALGKDGYIFK
jgi:CHAT domain-containing protein